MLRIATLGLPLLLLHMSVSAQVSSTPVTWAETIEVAKKDARTQNKKIFLYFSGSDWCKPCIQLREKEINSEAFSQFAKNHLILLQVDFPRLKKNQLSKERVQHNEVLAEKYNSEGIFPLVVILNADGEMLGKIGYREEKPEEFIKRMQRFVITRS